MSALRDAWGVPVLEVHESIGSTSDRVFELAATGARPFTVVIADEQTAGRGRRGALWHSAKGAGLWMSVLLPPARAAPHVPLSVGLAVAEALEEAHAGLRIGIKWPNDLVTERGKLGGVLCESASSSVVAGVGINVRAPTGGYPPELSGLATSLEAEYGKSFDRNILSGIVVRRIKARLERLEHELSPGDVSTLAQRDVLGGREVVTEEHGVGTSRGVDAGGALLLERADGSRVRVVAGSVRAL